MINYGDVLEKVMSQLFQNKVLRNLEDQKHQYPW